MKLILTKAMKHRAAEAAVQAIETELLRHALELGIDLETYDETTWDVTAYEVGTPLWAPAQRFDEALKRHGKANKKLKAARP